MDPRYRARVFSVLSDFCYYAPVVQDWRGHRTQGESDPESLAQVTRALIELGRKRQARDLMVSWHDPPRRKHVDGRQLNCCHRVPLGCWRLGQHASFPIGGAL
jgi:hypothetical protein